MTVAIGDEKYDAKGSRVTSPGWLSIYSYYKPDEKTLPKFDQGTQLAVEKAQTKKLTTKPPDRFSKASIIALLERKDLGTKATRAAIIDTLFNRGYITGKRIEVTEYGMSVYGALIEYCEPILDEAMTRQLEVDMEEIIKGKTTKQAVIAEGKDVITKTIALFQKNEPQISESLKKGLETSSTSGILGKCPKDGGNLIIKYSRAGKQFVSCANWPTCNTGYPLPGNAKIVPTGKVCPHCHTPIVKVFRFKKVFEMDLDPTCITKKDWAKKPLAPATAIPPIKKASEIKSAAAPTAVAPKPAATLPTPAPVSPAQNATKITKEIKKPAPKKKEAGKAKPAKKKKE